MPERKKGNHDRKRNQKLVKRLIKRCRKDGKSSRLLYCCQIWIALLSKRYSIPKDSAILYESLYLCIMGPRKEHRNKETCTASLNAVKDALYVLNGKWKLPLIISLQEGPLRFNEIQKSLGEITPKILSKELKDLELNEFVIRKVFSTTPVTVTYELTPYSESLERVIDELRDWGLKHRERLVKNRKSELVEAEMATSL
ncbi:DNA-binding HxlR family transcriptional regulator [Flavobacterium sp. W4I14]|nr:DNA-binding HxlR family transcriptional regulator [Flavobacterium sp. W4I14]